MSSRCGSCGSGGVWGCLREGECACVRVCACFHKHSLCVCVSEASRPHGGAGGALRGHASVCACAGVAPGSSPTGGVRFASEHTCACAPGHECTWEVLLRRGGGRERPHGVTPRQLLNMLTPRPHRPGGQSGLCPSQQPALEMSPCSPSWVPGLLGAQNLLPEHPECPTPPHPLGAHPPTCHYRWSVRSRGLLPAMWLLGGSWGHEDLWLLRGGGRGAEGAGQSQLQLGHGCLRPHCWAQPHGIQAKESGSWTTGPERSQTHPRMPSWPGSCLPRFWALRPYLPAPCLPAVGFPRDRCGEGSYTG